MLPIWLMDWLDFLMHLPNFPIAIRYPWLRSLVHQTLSLSITVYFFVKGRQLINRPAPSNYDILLHVLFIILFKNDQQMKFGKLWHCQANSDRVANEKQPLGFFAYVITFFTDDSCLYFSKTTDDRHKRLFCPKY